jgi:outer membrane protein, heavy metal efflux system
MKRTIAIVIAIPLVVTGCVGLRSSGEKQERKNLDAVSKNYRPQDNRPALPVLTSESDLADYMHFALLNQPQIEAAYYDWAGAVQKITVERSLPDPKLTFQSDIVNLVAMTLMPGIMQEFPGPGKLKAAANVATAESQAKYFTFESAVLQTAFDLERSAYTLHFLDEKIQIDRENARLLNELEKLARAQNEVGKVTLQDVYRAQIELDQVTTELANLEDSRRPLMAQFKGALGIPHTEPDPPAPSKLDTTPLDFNADELLATAFARNPKLKAMEADVRMAEANISVANKSTIPDFSIGLEADAKASPVLYRPLGGMTLPIWRDKISAQIKQALASKRANQARLNAEQIGLAVDFAMKTYDYRETTRNLKLLQEQLIPKARLSLTIARSGYLAGTIDFFNLINAQRTLLNFQMTEVDARTRREVLLAELNLTIAGITPAGAPVLDSSSTNINQTKTEKTP